jgi:hypothetical protein
MSNCGLPTSPLGFFAQSIVARISVEGQRGLVVRSGRVTYVGICSVFQWCYVRRMILRALRLS